jgi:hypothetical protein
VNRGARVLGAGAVVALAVSLAWDWSTPRYWETRPLVISLTAIGLLSGCAGYAWRKKLAPAVVCGVVSVIGSAVALSFVALRWAT